MKRKGVFTSMALAASLATTVLAPVAFAQSQKPDSTQKQKNDWRNLGIGAAAIAGYGLLNHNSAAALLGAAGAAYSASRYEQARKDQDADQRARTQYHRSDRDYESISPSRRPTMDYHRTMNTAAPPAGRKYYHYQGHLYYIDMGQRHLVQ
jgi:hypothetical protein